MRPIAPALSLAWCGRHARFSRAQHVLVLTAPEPPKDHFAPIWQGLPQWPYVQQELLAAQRFALRERMPVKKTYSSPATSRSTRPARASTGSSASTTSRPRVRP